MFEEHLLYEHDNRALSPAIQLNTLLLIFATSRDEIIENYGSYFKDATLRIDHLTYALRIDMLSSQVSSHSSVLMDFKFASIIKENKSELKTGEEKENRLSGLFLCAQLIQLF